ncbi:MAG: type VI secretion system contractile sheath small subunit [Myxococcales bacterium]|jgi:hypothetical protein
MTEIEEARRAARLHFLVVGRFGTGAGEPFAITRGELPELLQRASPSLEVEVPDRVGTGAPRRVSLRFDRLRDFSRAAVIDAVTLLRELRAVAEGDPANAAAEIERCVGRGALLDALREDEAAAARARKPRAAAPEGLSIDELLGGGGSAADDDAPAGGARASRAIDAFVRASRPRGRKRAAVRSERPAARERIEAAVQQTADDILDHPRVHELEVAWRGLYLLSEQLPATGDVMLEVADVEPGREQDAIALRAHVTPEHQPDAVFVAAPVRSLQELRAYAQLAEDLQSVCVVTLSHRSLGADSPAELARDLDGPVGQGWRSVRSDPAFRWLCVATNPILLHQEAPDGVAPRSCFGSPVFALAALMTRGHRDQGAFARLLAPAVMLEAPAVWVPPSGRDAGMALPTESFCSIRAQSDLGKHGITAIGSNRNGDRMLLSAVPTAYVDEHPMSLPGQMLAGRVVRLCRALAAEVQAEESDERVVQLFSAAAQTYFFPGMQDAVELDARVGRRQDGQREAQLQVRARRLDALTPFEIGFTLPIA